MGVKTRSQASSGREKWDKIFEGLVKMLKTQQQQLETLAKERKILEDRIKLQYERWACDVRLYEGQISQMKTDLETKEMARVLEASKADMMAGLKHREAYVYKLKLNETEDELTDFRIWFDLLTKNSQDVSQKVPKGMSGRKGAGSDSVSDGDLRKLKLEYEKLVSEKSSQITKLLAENKFAWNQFNLLESQLKDKLTSKHSDLEKANRKIETLISNMEELRSSNAEKDQIIDRLKADVSRKEADASKFREEVSKISREVELLRKSRSSSSTPILQRCAAGGRTSVLGDKNGGRNAGNVGGKKETSASKVPDLPKDSVMVTRSSRRKRDDVVHISETPKLFTSRFKVPKLKASSPRTR